MAEIVNTAELDSNVQNLANFKTHMLRDSNSLSHDIRQVEEKLLLRHLRFPFLKGRYNSDSLRENTNTDISFKKWNDKGECNSNVTYRTCNSSVDTTGSFISPDHDANKRAEETQMRSMAQLNIIPHAMFSVDKIRKESTETPELKWKAMWFPGSPTAWNSRKTLDVCIRSKLGGWTSDFDPRKPNNAKEHPQTSPVDEQSKSNRDKLMLKYMYGTSTQRAYEDVPWDDFLLPKQRPPTTTLEGKPDTVLYQWHNKHYVPAAQKWQTGKKERFLSRQGYYKDSPVKFCSSSSRTLQIPLYSGCIGADNMDEVDNAKENFVPYTVKRATVPRPTETAHQPNIPLYGGCTLWQGSYVPAHSRNSEGDYVKATTMDVHKPFPIEKSSGDHKRNIQMPKMITLDPLYKPFTTAEKENSCVKRNRETGPKTQLLFQLPEHVKGLISSLKTFALDKGDYMMLENIM